MDVIKNRINAYIQENNISIAELEKMAGLKIDAIRNILYGRSTNPSATTLQAIAKTLGCSIDFLLGEVIDSGKSQKNKGSIKDFKLFSESVSIILDNLKAKEYEPTFDELVSLIKEVYYFSLERKPQGIDQNFVNWIISTSLEN